MSEEIFVDIEGNELTEETLEQIAPLPSPDEPFVYKSKPKGAPSVSGRSQSRLGRALAMRQPGAVERKGQQKGQGRGK